MAPDPHAQFECCARSVNSLAFTYVFLASVALPLPASCTRTRSHTILFHFSSNSFGADMFFTTEGAESGSSDHALMQTESMREMLTQISKGLSTAMTMIYPERREQARERKVAAFQKQLLLVNEEHKRVLQRKV